MLKETCTTRTGNSMIAFIIESTNDLSLRMAQCGIPAETEEIQTSFGRCGFYRGRSKADEEFVWFPGGGTGHQLELLKAPLAVAEVLAKWGECEVVLVGTVGGINLLLETGDIVIPDDFVDRTVHRPRSFVQKNNPCARIHYTMQNALCPSLRAVLYEAAKSVAGTLPSQASHVFRRGTYICSEGPSFERNAEIQGFRQLQADIVGHSLVPYVYYMRELKMCFACLTIVSNVYRDDGGPCIRSAALGDFVTEACVAILAAASSRPPCRCRTEDHMLTDPRCK